MTWVGHFVSRAAMIAVSVTTAQAEPTTAQAEPTPITMRAAVEAALRAHPRLAVAVATTEGATARIDQTRAAFLPRVTTATQARESFADPLDFTSSTPVGFADQFSYDVSASVDKLVTDFGSTGYRVAAARAAERGARSRVSITRLDVERSVVAAYLDILRNKELVAVSLNAIKLVEAQRERANALFKATIRPEIDVLSADTQLAQAELGRLRDENGVATAMLALREAMGTRDTGPLDVVSVEIKPLDDEPRTLDELATTSIRRRPELVAGREDILAAEANVDVTRTRVAPVVAFQAGGFANGSQDSWTPGVGVFAALSLSITLYDGTNRHAIRDARAQVHSARAQLELTQQAITFSVARAALAVKIARESLQVANTWRVQAERQLALAQTRYQNNVGNFVELNDARAGLVTAQRNEIDARYGLAQSRVSLARELGIAPLTLANSQP